MSRRASFTASPRALPVRGSLHGESGFMLIESLMSLAILGFTAVIILIGMAAYARADLAMNERTTADTLAASQMDNIKRQAYILLPHPVHNAYAVITPPSGYSVASDAAPLEPSTGAILPAGPDYGLQKITVTVNHGSKVATTLVGYKVNR